MDRPKTTPFGILAILLSLLTAQLTLLIDSPSSLHAQDIPAICELLNGLAAVAIVLCMPLSDPDLPKDQICPTFGHPTSQLRSPEDNLTLWQFMTVSWMTPLISLGSTRRLNDEDVWSLAFEFQHSVLHDSFRELKGSVVSRLIAANGLDLVIISFLAILESLAGMESNHDQIL